MIPRFRVPLVAADLAALLLPARNDVEQFERRFAEAFGAPEAVAFAYGRTAQWAFLRAVGVCDAEVVMPAYTCSVVAHAVSLSGNIPVFVDISLDDYNSPPERIADAVGPRTRAIIATNTFGYPQDTEALRAIVTDAEQRYGHKVWLVEDCAHSFGATFAGESVAQAGDVAVFGLNISKILTSIFGGMLLCRDRAVADLVRAFRAQHTSPSALLAPLRQRAYALAAATALSRFGVSATQALLSKTHLLDRWATAYHLDDQIHFPPDYDRAMTAISATIGVRQLARYDEIISLRRQNATYYSNNLVLADASVMGPLRDGATYSHFVARVPDRAATVAEWRRRGVQLGELIQYSVPHLGAYLGPTCTDFPNSLLASRHLVNFPINVTPRTARSVAARSRLA
ncbi:MAG: DegT/DnrJ/EryC1/StrS family aminotransferase [Ilumatobacteraceae bacterium]